MHRFKDERYNRDTSIEAISYDDHDLAFTTPTGRFSRTTDGGILQCIRFQYEFPHQSSRAVGLRFLLSSSKIDVEDLQVTNDMAERGIAWISKYSGSITQDSDMHVTILQFAEADCRQFLCH